MKNEYNIKINQVRTKVIVCSRNGRNQCQMVADSGTLE